MPDILKALFQGYYQKSALRDTSFNLTYADCHEDIFNRFSAMVSVILQDINNCWTVDDSVGNWWLMGNLFSGTEIMGCLFLQLKS